MDVLQRFIATLGDVVEVQFPLLERMESTFRKKLRSKSQLMNLLHMHRKNKDGGGETSESEGSEKPAETNPVPEIKVMSPDKPPPTVEGALPQEIPNF